MWRGSSRGRTSLSYFGAGNIRERALAGLGGSLASDGDWGATRIHWWRRFEGARVHADEIGWGGLDVTSQPGMGGRKAWKRFLAWARARWGGLAPRTADIIVQFS